MNIKIKAKMRAFTKGVFPNAITDDKLVCGKRYLREKGAWVEYSGIDDISSEPYSGINVIREDSSVLLNLEQYVGTLGEMPQLKEGGVYYILDDATEVVE